VTGNIGTTQSTFVLTYTAPAGGFSGTLTYRLPFSFADYKAGLITFSPTPASVTEGSVVAAWDVNLKANEKFGSTVNVNKKVEATVLSQFTAPTASSKPPAGAATAAPTQAGQQGTATGTKSGGLDTTTTLVGILLLAIIAIGIYFYIGKKK
jgi:hypothetical protein